LVPIWRFALDGKPNVMVYVGSRPVFENRVPQMKDLEALTPSTSVAFPSSVTVYIGDKSNKRELT